MFAGFVSATHTSSVDLQPEWSPAGQSVNYTVTFTNNGPDAVGEVRIYKNENYNPFNCDQKTGWLLSEPAPGICNYYAYPQTDNKISPGNSEFFTFSATTPPTDSNTCDLEWKFETRDITFPVTGSIWYLSAATSVDDVEPLITKTVIGPQNLDNTGELCPNGPGQGEECWITQSTQIVVEVVDQGICGISHLDYCIYSYTVDGVPHFEHTFNPVEPSQGISWEIYFDEDSVHELTITCADVAGNEITDVETFRVDNTPPVTTKVYGAPHYPANINDLGAPYPHWITTQTPITLDATDGGLICAIDGTTTYYFDKVVDNSFCEDEDVCQSVCPPMDEVSRVACVNGDCPPNPCVWQTYSASFTKGEESCHILQFYSKDALGNVEPMNTQCVFVEDQPPVAEKTVGMPNVTCSEDESITGNDLSLILENKDSSSWQQIIGDGIQATLEYNDMGPEFKYSLTATGLQNDTEYSLIYYADFDPRFDVWGGNNPGALITTITADGSGNIVTTGSTNLGINLPSKPDWNIDPTPNYCNGANGFDYYNHCSGAKIWLVPSSDYDAVNKKVINCNPTQWLFETDLISYTFAECFWAQKNVTEITLDCDDQGPHPVNHSQACYKVSFDETPFDLTSQYCPEALEGEWCCIDTPKTLIFNEESVHGLEYYCKDALENTTEIDLEYFRVDGTAPVITKTMIGTENIDWMGVCPPKPSTDKKCFVSATGGVNVAVSDPDTTEMDCNVDQVTCDYKVLWGEGMTQQECNDAGYDYYGEYGGSTWCFVESGTFGEDGKDFFFAEDSKHKLTLNCVDALGNMVVESEDFLVDLISPVTTKTYGDPTVVDGDYRWITSQTLIDLNAVDEKIGVKQINYRVTLLENMPDELCTETCRVEFSEEEFSEGEFTEVLGNTAQFTIPKDSCHFIEFYAKDLFGYTEEMNSQCVFVDNQEPLVDKNVGDPQVECDDESDYDCHYYITQQTPITLTCIDKIPHPVDNVSLEYNYRVSEDCQSWGDWIGWTTSQGEQARILFPTDSCHELEYKCEDVLGNATQTFSEIDIVDTVGPEISTEIVGPSIELSCEQIDKSVETCTYIDGVTEIHVGAVDPTPHPVEGVLCNWDYEVIGGDKNGTGQTEVSPPFVINFPEESHHELTIDCQDALGNTSYKYETYFVDKTPPVTDTNFGLPYFTEYGKEWITTATDITLTVDDAGPHQTGIKETKYRITRVADGYCDPANEAYICENASSDGIWMNYSEIPFHANEESCHLIEYYSIDNVDKTETVNKECVYVDETPPTGIKTVGVPRTYCEEGMDCEEQFTTAENGKILVGWEWKITQLTPITLSCTDEGPHPVNHSTVCYRYFLDGNTENFLVMQEGSDEDGWVCMPAGDTFYFPENSMHQLEFYCEDALGNTGPTDIELIKVEGTEFKIPLNIKWNLISVPFTLFNDDPAVIFAGIADHIESVWAYDAVTGWKVYRPNGTGPQNLYHIEPGWGYWVYSNQDDLMLTLGGNLMPTGNESPLSRALAEGWNLIGYYGTNNWEQYSWGDFSFTCGDEFTFDALVYGNKAYCSLSSLTDLASGPKWDAVYSYVNCGNHNDWSGFINTCADPEECDFLNRMYAGRGYWIAMDEADNSYVPANGSCIWNENWVCV